jgi:ATP-dependent helicase HrpA
MEAIVDRALFDDDGATHIRSQETFASRAETAWKQLPAARDEVVALIAEILEGYNALDISLGNDFPPLWSDSIRDMRDQLVHLIYRGFILQTPFNWLGHLPRYLRAIDMRLKKLANAGLNRDAQVLAEVRPLWEKYKQRAARHREQGIRDSALEQYRWMLEELRVSLFAQELKAALPVSASRLQRLWEDVRP